MIYVSRYWRALISECFQGARVGTTTTNDSSQGQNDWSSSIWWSDRAEVTSKWKNEAEQRYDQSRDLDSLQEGDICGHKDTCSVYRHFCQLILSLHRFSTHLEMRWPHCKRDYKNEWQISCRWGLRYNGILLPKQEMVYDSCQYCGRIHTIQWQSLPLCNHDES